MLRSHFRFYDSDIIFDILYSLFFICWCRKIGNLYRYTTLFARCFGYCNKHLFVYSLLNPFYPVLGVGLLQDSSRFSILSSGYSFVNRAFLYHTTYMIEPIPFSLPHILLTCSSQDIPSICLLILRWPILCRNIKPK